ncbi:S41 family peptidase [Aquisalibacillus elongatus]|uniref:C-terminal processing protease CtpA/Prc n=1 Tax=Aquisalibacillus elongatus TaxID=485577 RepID=A0A3N5C5B4_9BACI|nr:S41 family peptidase [Aquisalibacillus elongatus]RPF53365.1 C-terminal processing protease CtpA/Prc [Aquisalibacillus elongatus]
MYEQIFEEIVDIVHHDYSGCEDKEGWDEPDIYKQKIQQIQTNHEFVNLVEDYLADFQDPHMSFRLIGDEKNQDVGFRVRRFNDVLYVTEIVGESRLEIGDRIIALDNKSVIDLCESHKKYLYEKPAERENWRPILNLHQIATVEKTTGETVEMDIRQYKKVDYKPEYSFEQLNEDTAYLKITDFLDPDAINELIKEHETSLNDSDFLIVDVRKNLGGTDSAFNELLPYIFPKGETKLEFVEDYVQFFNTTNRNADLTIQFIQEYLEQVDDPQFKKSAQSFIDDWEKNRGKGFISFEEEDPEIEPIYGKENPKKVIVLSDVYCGSAGDVFVEVCKLSEKVTVLGRGTAGVNDYSNLARMKWDDQFELLYPTSKLRRVNDGKGMTGVGILPDIYIPWTPEHLERDVDLKKALDLLES